MAKYKITFDRKACIGSGACTSVCPENWELVEKNGEFKAKPKKLEISEEEYTSNAEAAAICPVECITIEKIKTKKKIIDEGFDAGDDEEEEDFD
ncbi:MAG: ferredoxin [archaeon GW2011_AR17]|nr:MAG: ferredoxin [archaeon GW2011_AR17]MBS3154058.1 ferredoxin [Candidatus Woesearchaeota archaeon]HIH15552.1 ferredoxin [Nanoarchaeota archaeon]HIH59116.1 ferredoxin [Nanoarchaeota archaeon]HII14596.1 ferredoxin [Nanoarchaeota archaeon]